MAYQLFGEAKFPQHIPVSPYRSDGEMSGFVTSVLAGEGVVVDAEGSGGDDAENGNVLFESFDGIDGRSRRGAGMVDAEECEGDNVDNVDVPLEILKESMSGRGQMKDVCVASMKVRTAEERWKFSDTWPPYMKVDVRLWTGTR